MTSIADTNAAFLGSGFPNLMGGNAKWKIGFYTLNVFFYQYGNEAELHSRYHGTYAAKSFTYILSRFNIEADFAKISSRNLPTLLIGSLNPFQHLESPNISFTMFRITQKKTCCLPSCRELPAPCQNPLFSPPSKIPHSQSPGTSLARVSALLETGGKCVMWEKPFSVEESSFRMALGRKAGWGERLKNLIHSIVFILGMAMRTHLPMRIVADISALSDICRI